MRTLSLYMPIILMGLLALGSGWLARNTPVTIVAAPTEVQRQAPDYFLDQFSVKNFDAQGVLGSEILGEKARHMPATDILEVDEARFRASRAGRFTTGQGDRAYSNGDGSEVQLVGNALVVREASKDAQGQIQPRLEIRSEFLHAFFRTEEFKSHKPVTITRGGDVFNGDSMQYNKIEGVVQLTGRVRVQLETQAAKP